MSPTDSNAMKAALEYASRGWYVIPLHSNEGSNCTCGNSKCKSAGKHPRINDWRKDATTETSIIKAWWTRWPSANIGIVTGRDSGMVVVDVDGDEGDAAFRRLCAEQNFMPETLTATTGRGRHHYFAHPGVEVPNSARTVADGVDVRGDGGYIVAPLRGIGAALPTHGWQKTSLCSRPRTGSSGARATGK